MPQSQLIPASFHGCGHPDVSFPRCAALSTPRQTHLCRETVMYMRSGCIPPSYTVKCKVLYLQPLGVLSPALHPYQISRSFRLWVPRGRRRDHLSKEMSVIHVKWPVREPSHLLTETWNGKHVQLSTGPPQALASSQEMEWWRMEQTREFRQPTCLGVSQCKKHLLGGNPRHWDWNL